MARQIFQCANLKELRDDAPPKTHHARHVRMVGDHNNNKMERLNGEIRDRENVRGIKKMDSV